MLVAAGTNLFATYRLERTLPQLKNLYRRGLKQAEKNMNAKRP